MPLCRFTHLLHGGTLIDVCGDTPLLCEEKKKAKQRVAAPRMPPFGSFFQIPSTPKRRIYYVLQGQPLVVPTKFSRSKCGDKDRFFWHHLFFSQRKGGRFSPLKGSEAAAGECLQKAADFEHRECTEQATRIDRRA